MKWRSTTVLAAVALLLGVYLLAFERSMLTTDEAKAREKRIWADGDVDAVLELVVDKGGVAVTLQKTPGGDWQMVAPITDLGDETEITSVLNQLEFADAVRDVSGVDPATYGMTAPRLVVRVTSRGGAKVAFLFGREAPGGKDVYVQKEGHNEILLVDKALFEAFGKDVNFWRDKRLIAAARAKSASWTISSGSSGSPAVPGETFAATVKNGLWVATTPAPGRAADAAVDKIFAALGELKIDKFVDDAPGDLAKYGLAGGAAPGGSASVTETGGRVLAVRFGSPEGDGLYALREGGKGVFLVRKAAVDALAGAAKDVRERVLFPHAPLDVKAITLTRDGLVLALEKETSKDGGDTWKITKPKEGTADLMEVENALRDLRKLTVTDFLAAGLVTPAAAGLEPGLAVLEVKVGASVDLMAADAPDLEKPGGSDRTDRLVIGNLTPDGKARYATRAEEGVVLTVPIEAWDLLSPSPLRFQDRAVMKFNKWDARELTIVRPGGTVKAVSEAGAWKIEEPLKAPGDKDALEAILTLASELKADELVELDAKEPAKYGLAAPRWRVTVKTKGFEADAKEETHVVELGGDAGGGKIFGWVPEKKTVFKIALAAIAPLDKDVVSKKVTGLSAWDVKSLAFKGAAGELELMDVDGAWRIMKPTAADATKERVDAWVKENVEDLAAEKMAPETPDAAAAYGFATPRLTVTVGTPTGNKVYTVAGKDSPDGLAPVRLEGGGMIWFITQEKYLKLAAKAEDFTGPAPASMPPPLPLPGAPDTAAPATGAP